MNWMAWRKPMIAVIAVYFAVFAAAKWGLGADERFFLLWENIPPVASLAMLLLTYRARRGSAGTFWLLMAAGACFYLLGQLVWSFYAWGLLVPPPKISLADLFWNLHTVLFFAALFYLLFREKSISQGIRFLFDCIMILLIVGTVSWEFVIEPNLQAIMSNSDGFGRATVLSYPITDFGMLLSLFVLHFAYMPLFDRRVLALITFGFVAIIGGDTIYVLDIISGKYQAGQWYGLLWSAGLFAYGFAGWHASHPEDRPVPEPRIVSGARLLRLFFPYAGFAILFLLMLRRIDQLDAFVTGTVMVTVLILVRQISMLLENEKLVSRLKQMLEKSEFLASHDDLSGLPNKRLFERKAQEAIENASLDGQPLAVLFLDLDRFKYINDSLGHVTGDELIRQVAERIRRIVPETCIVARQGGDEFTILTGSLASSRQAQALAESILRVVAEPFKVGVHEIQTSTSIGIAVYPEDGLTKADLMKHADAAMYQAKELGGGRFRFFTPSLKDGMLRNILMERALRHALDHDELFLCYQPQVCSEDLSIVGAEALLRWRNADGHLVPPSDFVPLAEDTGLIVPIGDWVIRTACRQAVDWEREGRPPLKIAVNVSPRQLVQDGFVDKVTGILKETGMAPGRLIIEITEGVALQNTKETTDTLLRLKALGLHISMDDFGTGYSSLGYLRTFQVDSLKIAQSFVGEMAENEGHAGIVKAIMAMARSLNLSVVVEGVETEEQVKLLRAIGGCTIQGYYFYKPMLPDEFSALWDKAKP
ncbi:EAL domain-containing protein [Paenibacillus sp. MZ04-78.2]|uniref:putative bifunctional diguanylate cyclase/phosphodiesterase n=1 Tax=Paenibacillus sp. MZ04-78.2 TaxID=2962034 RepID=UPI0020B7AFC0|nr:EAL domain-containing protein [Paenibacillus sp. MZ04-78.2]MCP3774306.1 EAL domain-containing protein [Paenibacillus sp. MZ04-78.2]